MSVRGILQPGLSFSFSPLQPSSMCLCNQPEINTQWSYGSTGRAAVDDDVSGEVTARFHDVFE